LRRRGHRARQRDAHTKVPRALAFGRFPTRNGIMTSVGRKITAPMNARIANHLALIRSFLIDSGHSRASREAICVKFFCAVIALHKITIDEKFTTHAPNIFLCAAFV
jgi:hypothetical protein